MPWNLPHLGYKMLPPGNPQRCLWSQRVCLPSGADLLPRDVHSHLVLWSKIGNLHLVFVFATNSSSISYFSSWKEIIMHVSPSELSLVFSLPKAVSLSRKWLFAGWLKNWETIKSTMAYKGEFPMVAKCAKCSILLSGKTSVFWLHHYLKYKARSTKKKKKKIDNLV